MPRRRDDRPPRRLARGIPPPPSRNPAAMPQDLWPLSEALPGGRIAATTAEADSAGAVLGPARDDLPASRAAGRTRNPAPGRHPDAREQETDPHHVRNPYPGPSRNRRPDRAAGRPDDPE